MSYIEEYEKVPKFSALETPLEGGRVRQKKIESWVKSFRLWGFGPWASLPFLYEFF